MSHPLLREIRAVNFRSARHLVLRPGRVCAFIGEPGAGKSNGLFAVRALLDPGFDLSSTDVTFGERELSIEATLAGGRTISLTDRAGAPPIVHFPAAIRDGHLVEGNAESLAEVIRGHVGRAPAPRVALVRGLEACADVAAGTVFAIEEPELFLAPQGHRYLYRLAHRLAERGNQVFFTTHSPGLLNVAALDEVHLVSRDALGITSIERLRRIDVDETFRVLCEFDAERAELFFSRAAILVEGMTEKMTLPFIFRALGHDADREQISIIECGGKANIPLFVEICRRARIPYVVVHDSDMRPWREPVESEVKLNALIRRRAGARRTVVLEPDFEGVAGFRSRSHKPEHAWSRLAMASRDQLPAPLVRAIELALATARPGPPTYS
ncbi:MAG TPA: TOPRIM nucleotidyl transferase/hydrolase domain-containing protein [Actinomycetota bacterium]|nr:TOPRIM nucleotidyl transferase/hydrolase domain-containing protein [Actinomycetota bacterium]